jgi:hypothetical protein
LIKLSDLSVESFSLKPSGKMLGIGFRLGFRLVFQFDGGNMEKFFEDYLQTLEALHIEIEKALEGLPQAAMDWPPGREMNSIAVLIVHPLVVSATGSAMSSPVTLPTGCANASSSRTAWAPRS